jgi:hypothetical protein
VLLSVRVYRERVNEREGAGVRVGEGRAQCIECVTLRLAEFNTHTHTHTHTNTKIYCV